MEIVTDIPTTSWNAIVDFLQKNKWKIKKQYPIMAFDKGIDYDYYLLVKNNLYIEMAWCNWFEGELKTDSTTFIWLESQLNFSFQKNTPNHLNI
ncbi:MULTISPECIES: hypothetical protein [Myroides]|uniref:Uncharacterized protein n=1 Tax=Myroides albus TaxID=2562892 RepID=A0A6I3LMJ8_9FLAO|nr:MULTISPECIES: hypothetical protein [Myroides]MTG99094.1 hypothetical protein [Myroides albus]MVX34792.1 hypothetical protein [Myroides sp. LoEW2-1]UVD80164.1 hypothetical protein NWE55_02425 [Myroides albus]